MIDKKSTFEVISAAAAVFLSAALLPPALFARSNGPTAFGQRAAIPGTLTVTGTQTIGEVGECSNVQITVTGDITGDTDDGGGADQVRFELWDDGSLKDSEEISVPVGSTVPVSVSLSFLGLYQTGAPGVGVIVVDPPSNGFLFSFDPFLPTDVVGPCPTCDATPRTPCDTAQKAQFQYRDKDPTNQPDKRGLKFVFNKGTARDTSVFGDPTAGTEHSICIYENGSLSAALAIPPGASWSAKPGKGFKYKNKSASDIQKVQLKAGSVAQPAATKIKIKGKGAGLPALGLPLTEPVTVQVVNNANSSCFGAEFPTAKKNANGQYKANQ
jgi:hypothetical protein